MATATTQNAISDTLSRKRKLEQYVSDSPRPIKRVTTSPATELISSAIPRSEPNPGQDEALVGNPALSMKPDFQPSQTSQGKSNLPTSPVSHSLSQTSLFSYNAGSPSTASSSVLLDDDVGPNGIASSGKQRTHTTYPDDQENAASEPASRSPSVASIDGVGRSSARARKPTSKAQALAEAGKKFFRNLQRASDDAASTNEMGPNKTIHTVTEQSSAVKKTEIPGQTRNEVLEPTTEPSILNSVETPSSTPVRSSSRQRKPTLKAAAAEADLDSAKRTASPLEGERPSKVARTAPTTPREPSKLRQSLSSVDDNAGEDFLETPDAQQALQGTELVASDPETASISTEPTQESLTDRRSAICNLTRLSPAATLLAFARYAADDVESDGSDAENEAKGQPQNLRSVAISGNKSRKMAKETIIGIIEEYHPRSKKHGATTNNTAHSAHQSQEDDVTYTLQSGYDQPSEKAQDPPKGYTQKSNSKKSIGQDNKPSRSKLQLSKGTDGQGKSSSLSNTITVTPQSKTNTLGHTSAPVLKFIKSIKSQENENEAEDQSKHSQVHQPNESKAPGSGKKGKPSLKHTPNTKGQSANTPKGEPTITVDEKASAGPKKKGVTSIILRTSGSKNQESKEVENSKAPLEKAITLKTKSKGKSRRSDILDARGSEGEPPAKSKKAHIINGPVGQDAGTPNKSQEKAGNSEIIANRVGGSSTPSLKITLKVRALPE